MADSPAAGPAPRMPSLDALDLLTAVADSGSVSAAARATGMAQPNASRMLSRLERTLGATLLRRGHGGATLTRAGAEVVARARVVLDAADDLLEAVARPRPEPVRVAASMTVAEHHLPHWIARLRRRLPDAAAGIDVVNSAEVLRLVAEGAAELGFIESPGPASAALRSRVVATDRLTVVVAPDHPWAGRGRPLRPAELAATPLVVREAGSGTREALDLALATACPAVTRAEPAARAGSATAVLMSAVAGVAPAVVPVVAAAPLLAAGLLAEVAVDALELRRPVTAVWSGPHRPPGAAGMLLAIAAAGR